jgi:hypothetical protein
MQFPQSDLEQGQGDGWQTVAHGKTRKLSSKNLAPPTPPLRRGPSAPTNRRRTARPDSGAQDIVTPESTSSSYPALTADVALALNAEELPGLPSMTQSEEAFQKVMARKKKKKDKRKKKRSGLESESSHLPKGLLQQLSEETQADGGQEMTTRSHSQFLANVAQQGSQESQGHGSDIAANVTDEETSPNGRMINLAATSASQPSSISGVPSTNATQPGSASAPSSASVSQPHSTAAPPSASASQSASSSTPPSGSASQPGSSSAPPLAGASQPTPISLPPPATTTAACLVHKFGALEGPTRIVCHMPGCDQTTSPWDGSTVICPSCGPYSSIRYCCIDHLLGDTTDHWGVDCVKYTCHHLCDASTIHPRQVQCPPGIPNLCGWNTPERHRQAVYHAHSSKKNGFAEVEGDYFIFTDAEEWIQAGSPDMQTWNLRRARGAVLVVVSFDDERSPDSLKDRFNRLLNIALSTGASNVLLLEYLFLMIRENLLSRGKWDDTILDSVLYQFQWEFAYQVPEWIINSLRHACPHQWYSTPIDQCRNGICNREMLQPVTRHPLSPRFSIKEKAEELERRYWILRVARVYHPNIQDPAQRMMGVGFSFMAPENRRAFRMGREWDGFPSGTMEIEGARWVPTAGGPPRLQVANLMTLTV